MERGIVENSFVDLKKKSVMAQNLKLGKVIFKLYYKNNSNHF